MALSMASCSVASSAVGASSEESSESLEAATYFLGLFAALRRPPSKVSFFNSMAMLIMDAKCAFVVLFPD
jgi:hypothetical protein